MKQTLILRFYAIFALICYFLLSGSFYPLWFSFAIFLISIYSLLRGVFFALDSATWLGLFLFFIASIGAFNVIFGLKNWEIVCLCFFFAGFSSILVGFTYKNILLFKISFLLLIYLFVCAWS